MGVVSTFPSLSSLFANAEKDVVALTNLVFVLRRVAFPFASSFHTNLLPHLWSFPLPPSPRPSKLLLTAVLAASTLLHPSPQITPLHVQASHLLDLALSDLVLAPLRPPPPNRDAGSKPSEPGELDDIVGLCVTMTWLVGLEGGGGGGRRGEVLMGLAWRLAADKCLRGGKVAEEHRKRVWELVQVSFPTLPSVPSVSFSRRRELESNRRVADFNFSFLLLSFFNAFSSSTVYGLPSSDNRTHSLLTHPLSTSPPRKPSSGSALPHDSRNTTSLPSRGCSFEDHAWPHLLLRGEIVS